MTQFLKTIIRFIKPGQSILDIGAGDGRHAALFVAARAFVKAVDTSTPKDGTIRFYGGGQGSLAYSETTDGKSWSAPVATNIDGGDPGITTTEDGEFLLIYVEPKQ